MSKTTQFTRHPWTHRSEFQKTKEFRIIDFEDCTVSGAKALVPDSDDELSGTERAAKRRRIEKLAHGYLRGDALFISTARPCPQALKRTIAWHKKSSDEPGYILPELKTPSEPSQVWKHVEDDDEILARLVRSAKTRLKGKAVEVSNAEPQEDLRAQASCRPQSRLRNARVEIGPSEDALRRAAALRDRRGRRAVPEVLEAVEEQHDVATAGSEASDCISVAQSERVLIKRRDRREWLSRRKSRFSFGGGHVENEADEPSSPCIEPSSPPSRSPRTSTPGQVAKNAGADPSPDDSDRRGSPQKASYHTAPEETEVCQEPVEAPHTNSGPAAQGPEPDPTVHGVQEPETLDEHDDAVQTAQCIKSNSGETRDQSARDIGIRLSLATSSNATVDPAKPIYLQAPSTQNGTTPLMYRKRSARPKPTTVQQESMPAPATRRSTRRRVTFPSSEDVPPNEAPRTERQAVSANPPRLDMTLEPDYSFAPKLNMALVEQHVNTLLPAEPKSGGGTTSVKKALRRELRNSGAEMSRCDSEPASSSQVEEAHHGESPGVEEVSNNAACLDRLPAFSISDSERRQTWLGTQAMVARAERDLFTSPEKQRGTFTPINEHTPRSAHGRRTAELTPASQEREPLKYLSQEPAPSTQAMLENFGGFSTVKKPRAASVLQRSTDSTPTAMEKGKRPLLSSSKLPGRPSSSADVAAMTKSTEDRRSSLRFSISTSDSSGAAIQSPAATAPDRLLEDPSTASFAREAPSSTRQSSGRRSLLKTSPSKPAAAPSWQPTTSQDDTTFISEDFPSLHLHFQAAQKVPERAMAGPGCGLLRDPSNMSQTIEDLTREVLGTGDVDGVLSQG